MKQPALALTVLTLVAPALAAQEFTPTRSISAWTQIEDEYYGDPFTVTDESSLDNTVAGTWNEAVEAEVTFAGSVTYADAGQWSWIDPQSGDFLAEGFAAGGLYNQYFGEMQSESLFQGDFLVATSGSVDLYYEFWFGDTFGGLMSHDRPGVSIAEVRIEDAGGSVVFEDSSTFEDGWLDGSLTVPLGAGQYRFVARAAITDASNLQTVVGSMTVANFYVEGSINGATPLPPEPPDTTPPAAPAGLGALAGDGIVALDWSDNGEADLAGYSVYRATTSGGPYALLTPSPIAASAYTDLAVSNGTTYFYVVTASDLVGNESAQSSEASASPVAPTPTMHVSSITTGISGPKRHRRGFATVVITDELGLPVAGAAVSGTFSGAYVGSVSGTTDGSGSVTFTTYERNLRNPVFTFCVDDVAHGSFDYDDAANVETCESYP